MSKALRPVHREDLFPSPPDLSVGQLKKLRRLLFGFIEDTGRRWDAALSRFLDCIEERIGWGRESDE